MSPQCRSQSLRTVSRLVVMTVVISTAGVVAHAVPASPLGTTAPVIADDFADPWVHLEGGTYYAYSTNHGQPDCWEANVPVRTSSDLDRWTCVSPGNDAMPTLPAWATRGIIWAPTVGRLDNGEHALYFASRRRHDGGWCVGGAFSSSGPRGPFVAQPSPFVCQDAIGGTIDPSFFRDVDGTEYLIYKSEGLLSGVPQQTWVRRLAPDGRGFVGAESKLIETTLPWEGSVTENPSMLRGEDGKYYLFYSGNLWFTDRYAVGYAVCETVVGPCTKPSDQPFLASQPGAVGPGAPALFRDVAGRPHLAYHAWTTPPCNTPECGNRSLFVTPLELANGRASLPCSGGGAATSASPTTGSSGYWMLGGAGEISAFGDAQHHGDISASLAGGGAIALDVEPTPSGKGYWILDSRGCVFAFGDARHFGSATTAALEPGEQVASISSTPTGDGYWIFSSGGRVLTYGNAVSYGDVAHLRLNGPVLDSVPTPDGRGYYMVASDGGVFTFGNAEFHGSMGGVALNSPVNGLVPDADGQGYWLVAGDGGVFAFGAGFRGSMGGAPLNRPVIGMVAFGNGYLMVGSDGGIFTFSDSPFHGSRGANPPEIPIVAVAVLDT